MKNINGSTRVGIVGGGAAGLMAAATLIEEAPGVEIVLFESSSRLGKKILVSGGGRCNFTTALSDPKDILDNYPRGSKFLRFAVREFPPEQVREWFERRGVRSNIEDANRVFPESNRSQSVLGVFERALEQSPRVETLLGAKVDSARLDDAGKFVVGSRDEEWTFDALVVAAGGSTDAAYGGYSIARRLGHAVTKLAPSLCSLVVADRWAGKLSGLSLVDCALKSTLSDGQKIYARGDLLFTHVGISGPATFELSALAAFEDISPSHPLRVFVSPMAGMNFDAWEKLLVERLDSGGAKKTRNLLCATMPDRLADRVMTVVKIDGEKKASEMSREQRRAIAHLMGEGIELRVTSRQKGAEIVTAGGVNLEYIDPKSCESKIVPNLYFAGEILDVDGLTGGFNLQNCWMTGRLAGKSIARKSRAAR